MQTGGRDAAETSALFDKQRFKAPARCGKAGANAIYYSIAFLITLLIAILAPIAALLVSPGYWLLLLPLLAVIAGPALLIASRANSPILFLRLCVLYFLYGLARAIDLLGLVPSKKTWKAR